MLLFLMLEDYKLLLNYILKEDNDAFLNDAHLIFEVLKRARN